MSLGCRKAGAGGGTLAAAMAVLLGLAGCRSVDPTAGLLPDAEIGGGPAPSAGVEPEPARITAIAPAGSVGPVQFLPVVGTPVPVAEALSKALATEAARAGVGLAPADAPATPLRLKGYFSAIDEGGETVVVYVWDVVDPAGQRVSRIQGKERVPGLASGGDPWASVTGETLAAIARRTIADLSMMGTSG